MTKAEFRDLVRREAGDEIRIEGTATGGSTTTVIDTAKLVQANNRWSNFNIFITDTADDLAPKNQSRFISTSTQSTFLVTVDLPFTAAVENGDAYAIAVLSNQRIDDVIQRTLDQYSNYRPEEFVESFQVNSGDRRKAPTSAASILYVDRIEYYNDSEQSQIPYSGWKWDDVNKVIDWGYWWSESKALKLYGGKRHVLPSAEATAITVQSKDIYKVAKWCAANVILSIASKQTINEFGNLMPTSWKTGEVSESYDFGKIRDLVQKDIDDIIKSFGMPVSVKIGKTPFDINYPNLGKIDTQADPDGRPAPTVFWKLNQ